MKDNEILGCIEGLKDLRAYNISPTEQEAIIFAINVLSKLTEKNLVSAIEKAKWQFSRDVLDKKGIEVTGISIAQRAAKEIIKSLNGIQMTKSKNIEDYLSKNEISFDDEPVLTRCGILARAVNEIILYLKEVPNPCPQR